MAKSLIAAIVAVGILYMADRQFDDGKITDSMVEMVNQIRLSFGG